MELVVSSSAAAAGATSPLELAWSSTYTADWEAQVKASYKPIHLTEDLWIIPDWHAPPSAPGFPAPGCIAHSASLCCAHLHRACAAWLWGYNSL